MNVAVVFAGGQGIRMHEYSRPKQFLEYRGKPIVIYTLDVFEDHPDIDGIIVVCLEDWMPYLWRQIARYHMKKIVDIVSGGETGQDSIYNGLECANRHYPDDTVVLIHDGVRPLVKANTITDCIRVTRDKGNCVVCVPAMETIVIKQEDGDLTVPDRDKSLIARAPQCFVLCDVLALHQMARRDGRHDFIDTCTMMNHYGKKFHTVIGSQENIKITTPADYFMFRAIEEAMEEGIIFGL